MSWRELTGAVLDQCMATFGENVTYTRQGGSAVTIVGVFNAQTTEIDPGSGLQVTTNRPTLAIKVSDLAVAPEQGDRVTVGIVEYKVREVTLDGEGGAILALTKV